MEPGPIVACFIFLKQFHICILVTSGMFMLVSTIRGVGSTIDNLRNGLETQAKVYATSVIRFTLEPCNFTLNTFQDFVFTYFKKEQKCEWNYGLLKLFREIHKPENHHLMFP